MFLIGNVQSRKSVEEVIWFASEKRLFLLADEVDVFKSSICLHMWKSMLRFTFPFTIITAHRYTKDAFTGRGASLSLTRRFWQRWDLLFQIQWSWLPSTLHPKAPWESEFSVLIGIFERLSTILSVLADPERYELQQCLRVRLIFCLSHQVWPAWWICGARESGSLC